MRQVQITTEAGVAIILMMLMLAMVFIIVQQSKFSDTLDEINESMKTTQQSVDSASPLDVKSELK